MPNVDAEQNTTSSQQAEATAASGFTLSEENLEALLRGVSGAGAPSAISRPTAPVPVQTQSAPAVEAIQPPPNSEEPTKNEEAAKQQDPLSHLASLQGARPVEAIPPPPFDATPVTITPLQIVPEAKSQPDVNSKLALISAIKQRRAETARPEAPVPTSPAVEHHEPQSEPEAEQDTAAQAELAAAEEIKRASSTRPSRVVSTPAAPRAMNIAADVQPQKATLPAQKVWTSGSAAPTEREPRRDEATEKPRLEAAKRTAPKPTVAAAPVAETSPALDPGELFASFGDGIPQEEAKPASFISSKAGMGVIGGAVAAAALAVYLLTAHGAKKQADPVKPAASPVEVSSAVSTTAPASDVKTAAPATATNQRASIPVSGTPAAPLPGTRSNTGQPASQQQFPAASPQANGGYQPNTGYQANAQQSNAFSQQSAVPETPRTVARTFTAPTAPRPANSTIVDAAPTVAINSAAPSAVGLPTRIAALPPPTAAAPSPATPAAPRQLAVPGPTQAARLARKVVPAYPAVAKAARVQGTVHFRAVIGADGAVKSLTTLGGPLPLAQAASDAVKQWRYQPTLVDGKPVEVTTQIDVAFTL